MDMASLSTIIGSVGFPIVAACALFYLYDNTIKNLTITLTKIDNTLDSVIHRLDDLERNND